MANRTQQIRIESILGGTAPMSHLAAEDQFRASLGINPALPIDNSEEDYSSVASGLLRPVGVGGITNAAAAPPKWIELYPKFESVDGDSISHYVYCVNGSVYSVSRSGILSGVGDLNDGGSSTGNGSAYYDNYIYFARDTTIARYGPLDGTPTFTDDYWATTLSKTALSNTTYPTDPVTGLKYPNHVMHRHSDGRLYVADVVDNRATLHYIQTSKTTVEGDTDNGSTYNKIQLGYGLYPTDMESYGNYLVITFIETRNSANAVPAVRAKIAFWDTTSQNVNQLVWVEYPDALLTAVVNTNGSLHFFSGASNESGFRVLRYVGGYSFEEVVFQEQGFSPHAGGVVGVGNQLVFGSASTIPETSACLWSLGLRRNISDGLFNIARAPESTATGVLAVAPGITFGTFVSESFVFGYDGTGSTSVSNTERAVLNTTQAPVWWSQTFRIGQPFKITKVRIPALKSNSGSTKQITPTIYIDDDTSNGKSLATLDYSTGTTVFVRRPTGITGNYNFWLELKWTGAGMWTVGLPIVIEYELIDD